jgi:DNA primase
VRYGEQIIYQEGDLVVRLGEYIISELRKDNIDVEHPLYQMLISEYMEQYVQPNWVAATYFKHHPNMQLSQLAVEMLADKYQLSRMYSRQTVSENVVKDVDPADEQTLIPELTQRLLLELKLTIVEERINTVRQMLQDAEQRQDQELTRAILEQYPLLINLRQQLCKALGNRVILS